MIGHIPGISGKTSIPELHAPGNCNTYTSLHTLKLQKKRARAHTHTRLTALFPGLPRWAGTRKVKPIWILVKQGTVSGSGISWAICKSAPCSRQTTIPAPHHSEFYRPDALPAAQPTASKHWRQKEQYKKINSWIILLFTKQILCQLAVLQPFASCLSQRPVWHYSRQHGSVRQQQAPSLEQLYSPQTRCYFHCLLSKYLLLAQWSYRPSRRPQLACKTLSLNRLRCTNACTHTNI